MLKLKTKLIAPYVLMLITIILLQSCLSFKVELSMNENNTGTVNIHYTFDPKVLAEVGLSDNSEPLFPWTKKDYILLAKINDGIELEKAIFKKLSKKQTEVQIQYRFRNIASLNQLLRTINMKVQMHKRKGRSNLLLHGRPAPEEVRFSDSTEIRYTEDAGFTIQIMRLLFPNMPLEYRIKAPKMIKTNSKGHRKGKEAILTSNLDEMTRNIHAFQWSVQW